MVRIHLPYELDRMDIDGAGLDFQLGRRAGQPDCCNPDSWAGDEQTLTPAGGPPGGLLHLGGAKNSLILSRVALRWHCRVALPWS